MMNGKKSPLITGNECQVLCSCTVDLISKAQRPWLFRVTVTGLPPHNCTRVYEIVAKDDNTAAMTGIKVFVDQMSRMTGFFEHLESLH